ncbi:MAG: hypothetical protein ACP5NF_02155, partial [Thermoanaerobaculum sp.]
AIQELRDAQARTEVAIQELRDAQARTEVAIQELRDAQARTEVAIQELRDAQARTEAEVRELAAAQRRTQSQLDRLTEEFTNFRKEVREEFRQVHKAIGGLTHTVGYTLENLACRTLPRLLKERFGWEVVEPLDRLWLKVRGKKVQVNLWGLVRTAEGATLRLVGEAKVQLGSKHLAELAKLMARTREQWGTEVARGVLVTHMPDAGVREEAERQGFLVFTSRELEAAA